MKNGKKLRLPSISKLSFKDDIIKNSDNSLNTLFLNSERKNIIPQSNFLARVDKSNKINSSFSINREKEKRENLNIFKNKNLEFETNYKELGSGPKYDSKGKILKRSILGSVDSFLKFNSKNNFENIRKKKPYFHLEDDTINLSLTSIDPIYSSIGNKKKYSIN